MGRSQFDQENRQNILESLMASDAAIGPFSESFCDHLRNDKVFCLSELPDSILMWSYYAQNHAGIVLRFRNRTAGIRLKQARKVRYVDQVPPLFDDETLSDMLAGYGDLEENKILQNLVWTKSSHWEHEQEWRAYLPRGELYEAWEDIPFDAEELNGVIFGARMTADEKTAIIGLIDANYPHVGLFQSMLLRDRYALDIKSHARCH